MEYTARQWKRIIVAFLVTLTLLTVFCTAKLMAASTLEDGEYTVDYEILKGDPKDDSTSLANGYWNKPATVIVKNGAISVRTVINKDAWVIEFATKQGSSFVDAKVISRDTKNDSRIVEFGVSSLEQDQVTSMTVDIPSMNYYHSYEARFRFYPDTLKLVKAAESEAKATPEVAAKPASTPEPAANTGSTSSSSQETASSAATAKPSSNSSAQQGSSTGSKEGSKEQATSGSGATGSAAAGGATTGTTTGLEGAATGGSATGATASEAGADSASTSQTAASGFEEQSENAAVEEAAEGAGAEQAGGAADNQSAGDASERSAEESTSTEDVEVVTASSAEVSDVEESESGSSTLVIILIAIAALFVIGSIFWIVKKGNSNKK